MAHVLALDQGTTSSRALVFDTRGSLVAAAQREFAQHFPAPGEVEHDAQEILTTQLDVAREALARAKLDARDIAALGITNQRETAIVWDRKTGTPIHRAIVWQDRRTTEVCERLRAAGHEALVSARTGLVLDPYFSATKIAWMLDHVPGARARAERGELAFGTVDTWLVWHLTGGAVHATDVTNASRTLLYDIGRGEWDDELLRLFDVPRALLPKVVASSGVIGESALLGAPIPIAGLAGDQQAALFGQGCHRAGRAKNTYGTGCFMLLNTGARQVASRARLITTRAAQLAAAPQYALEGSVFVAGAAVQWLRDGLGIIANAAEIEALAGSVTDAAGVMFVPAFTGLGAPHWDARARGTIVGITRGTTRAHLARAVLDAIALSCAEVLEAMRADAGLAIDELRVDGGASANNQLMQIQADALGVPVTRPRVLETTALGAAYLAGLATGVWPSLDAIDANWQRDRTFEPRSSADARAAQLLQWRRAIDRARDWA